MIRQTLLFLCQRLICMSKVKHIMMDFYGCEAVRRWWWGFDTGGEGEKKRNRKQVWSDWSEWRDNDSLLIYTCVTFPNRAPSRGLPSYPVLKRHLYFTWSGFLTLREMHLRLLRFLKLDGLFRLEPVFIWNGVHSAKLTKELLWRYLLTTFFFGSLLKHSLKQNLCDVTTGTDTSFGLWISTVILLCLLRPLLPVWNSNLALFEWGCKQWAVNRQSTWGLLEVTV